jgi:transglutaminase-like putative cysteine protease
MAALATLPRFTWAETDTAGKWRVFEVTTQVDILKPAGVTRAWVPVPLTEDTPYQKGQGNTWQADGATVSTAQDPKFGAAFVVAEWPEGVPNPTLTVISQVATRDRTVNLDKPGSLPKVDPHILSLYTGPTDLLPTDGIVRETAEKIVKGARGGPVAQARAIYEWVVESTFRDPKTRGCGLGDIKTMLETNSMGGKCADINALFVGLCRAVSIPARDVWGAGGNFAARF